MRSPLRAAVLIWLMPIAVCACVVNPVPTPDQGGSPAAVVDPGASGSSSSGGDTTSSGGSTGGSADSFASGSSGSSSGADARAGASSSGAADTGADMDMDAVDGVDGVDASADATPTDHDSTADDVSGAADTFAAD